MAQDHNCRRMVDADEEEEEEVVVVAAEDTREGLDCKENQTSETVGHLQQLVVVVCWASLEEKVMYTLMNTVVL